MSKEFSGNLGKAIDHLRSELGKLRTGRANPALLEDLIVDYYGSPTPLQQLASVTAPEPRMFLIQPYDKNSAKDIEKAIQSSDLGLNPTNEGDKIRITLPHLTEETRQDLVKTVKTKGEESKIAIRNLREEAISDLEKTDGASEDEIETGKKEIQDAVDKGNQEVEDLIAAKEKDIMTV